MEIKKNMESGSRENDREVYLGEFSVYRTIINDSYIPSPQYQGLAEDEYSSAISNPQTTLTHLAPSVDKPEQLIALPQLVPISEFEWLNPGFIAEKVAASTGEAPTEDIFHLSVFKELHNQVDTRVMANIRSIATNNGVVVVDYPSGDVEYDNRVQDLFVESSVEVKEVIDLGTQTYYAGKVRLKKGYRPDEPVVPFVDAFRGMKRQGIIPKKATTENGAVYQDLVDSHQANHMYKPYHAAFEQAVSAHPCRQGLTPEEFTDMLTGQPDVAKLVYYDNGDATTICLLGTDLTKFTWLNKDFFDEKFKDLIHNGELLYFPTLATDPDKQGAGRSVYIVNLIAEMVEYANNEIVVAFDCGDINKGFLDVMLEEMINATPQATIHFEEIGAQSYKAYKLTPVD